MKWGSTSNSELVDASINNILDGINKHFRAERIENYPNASMDFFVNEEAEKYLKSNKKLSKRAAVRITEMVRKRMRGRYGPYINVFLENWRSLRITSNFTMEFKTELGRIFGIEWIPKMFITTHALDRWSERTNPENYTFLNRALKKRYGTDPTALDTVTMSILFMNQIGLDVKKYGIYYLNINEGCLVCRVYGNYEIAVITTFLKYNMLSPYINWYLKENVSLSLSEIFDLEDNEYDLFKNNEIMYPQIAEKCVGLLDKLTKSLQE